MTVEQVGGTHYGPADAEGHWDFTERHDVAYLEATATKYVDRYQKKGIPAQDLLKAVSYLEKLLATRTGGTRRTVRLLDLRDFMNSRDYNGFQCDVFINVLWKGDRESIRAAIHAMQKEAERCRLLEKELREDDARAEVGLWPR